MHPDHQSLTESQSVLLLVFFLSFVTCSPLFLKESVEWAFGKRERNTFDKHIETSYNTLSVLFPLSFLFPFLSCWSPLRDDLMSQFNSHRQRETKSEFRRKRDEGEQSERTDGGRTPKIAAHLLLIHQFDDPSLPHLSLSLTFPSILSFPLFSSFYSYTQTSPLSIVLRMRTGNKKLVRWMDPPTDHFQGLRMRKGGWVILSAWFFHHLHSLSRIDESQIITLSLSFSCCEMGASEFLEQTHLKVFKLTKWKSNLPFSSKRKVVVIYTLFHVPNILCSKYSMFRMLEEGRKGKRGCWRDH